MIYAISDIHGEYDLLVKLLDKIKFSSSDTLLVLGDMIDKGLESVKVMKLLFSLSNAKCILGNHEYDFLKYYWAEAHEDDVDFDKLLIKLQEYFPLDSDKLDWDIMDRLEGLESFIEAPNFICVHSGVPVSEEGKLLPLDKVKTENLVYDRVFKDNNAICPTEKCVLFGHTPTRYLIGQDKIIVYPKANKTPDGIFNISKVHLDTGVYLSGILGCFNIDECRPIYVEK